MVFNRVISDNLKWNNDFYYNFVNYIRHWFERISQFPCSLSSSLCTSMWDVLKPSFEISIRFLIARYSALYYASAHKFCKISFMKFYHVSLLLFCYQVLSYQFICIDVAIKLSGLFDVATLQSSFRNSLLQPQSAS